MKHAALLGDVAISKKQFSNLDSLFASFHRKEFLRLPDQKRSQQINEALLDLIQKEPEPCFLLSSVLDFIERVNREKLLHHYNFSSFELWLNQVSGLPFEENFRVRGKIAGKLIDRSDYQAFFPIGMGKVYEGTHFVTAHKSPDLDTTIASFWGWLDAFAARVGDGLHVWNLPGGPPPQIEIDWIFRDIFGGAVFTHLPKTETTLQLTGMDLVTQKGMIQKHPQDSITGIDYDRGQNAVVVTDAEGFFLGDWRGADAEAVRDVILLLSSCLRWFENHLHLHWMGAFKQERLQFQEVAALLKQLFQLPIAKCEPALEFTQQQKKKCNDFLTKVLELKSGLDSSFEQFGKHLKEIGISTFRGVDELLARMKEEGLFDAKGNLINERPPIFQYLETTVRELHESIFQIRSRLEKLDIALAIKKEVFGLHPTVVTLRSELEEMKSKMGSRSYLTVNDPDQDRLFPVGVVHASDLRKNILGTVSLRDFCNRDEMGIPSYLEIISVIDHHKSSLQTSLPPFAILTDAQSSNSLIAKQAFGINDRYSCFGQTEESVAAQMEEALSEASLRSTKLAQTLLQCRMILKNKDRYFIHPEREFLEYLHFLYAILDDTDLLSKVSVFDVEIVVELLNRMKTLVSGRMREVLTLDDIPKNRSFPKKAAARILQNEEMYSLYRRVYEFREKEIEKNLDLSSRGKPSDLFADTKEQNGCCRIGQTKIFAQNISSFEKKADGIRSTWLKSAEEVYRKKPEIALHLHMMSTVVGAEEVYRGSGMKHKHKDELWLWCPKGEEGVELMRRFLNAFQASPGLKNNALEIEFLGDRAEEFSFLFKESFLEVPEKRRNAGYSLVVLRFNPGTLNSRKAMVSPFLPT